MDRRSFLKLLSTTTLAAVIPAAIVAAAVPRQLFSGQLGRYEGIKFHRMSELRDYDTKIGLSAGFRVGDDHYRHAVILPADSWEQFTPEQREETWNYVERTTFALSKRGGKS